MFTDNKNSTIWHSALRYAYQYDGDYFDDPRDPNHMGLMTTDGRIIITPEYSVISFCGLFHNMYNEDLFQYKANYCEVEKKKDKMNLHGGFSLDNSLDPLPCEFADATITQDNDGKYWSVKMSEDGSSERYQPGMKQVFRDEGEKLFLQNKIDETIDFYLKNPTSGPWVNYILGRSFHFKGSSQIFSLTTLIKCYKKGENLSEYEQIQLNNFFNGEDVDFDYDLAKAYYDTALLYIEAYLNSGDKEFVDYANVRYSTLISELSTFELAKAQNLKTLDEMYKERQRRNQEKQEALARAEAKRKENADLLLGVLFTFTERVISNSGSSSSASSASYAPASSGSYAPSSSSSASSSSSNASKIKEWENRRADAEKRKQHYEEELAKYPKDSAYYKRQIQTMEDIIKNCNEMIQFYQSN